MDGETLLSGFFEEPVNFSADHDIFSVLEAWENASADYNNLTTSLKDDDANGNGNESSFEFQKSSSSSASSPLISAAAASFQKYSESEVDASHSSKRQKLMTNNACANSQLQVEDAQNRISHIAVERNRRKQMNDHLTVLRSLMPCFYVKRGDQASIIGGVVDYINELQQVLQSLEAKKQRKSAYNEVLSPRLASSPRIASSPRPSPLSPRLPPLSPRLSLPISPRTPQPSSPYNAKPWMQVQGGSGSFLNSPSLPSPVDPSPCSNSINSSTANDAVVNELVATSKSALAEVEVKFSGPNLLLKTVSHRRRRVPGQVMKIVSALEELALEILHVSISTVDETMLNSFTIKIGIQCQLSAEDLAEQIQRTFS